MFWNTPKSFLSRNQRKLHNVLDSQRGLTQTDPHQRTQCFKMPPHMKVKQRNRPIYDLQTHSHVLRLLEIKRVLINQPSQNHAVLKYFSTIRHERRNWATSRRGREQDCLRLWNYCYMKTCTIITFTE